MHRWNVAPGVAEAGRLAHALRPVAWAERSISSGIGVDPDKASGPATGSFVFFRKRRRFPGRT